MTHPGPDSDAAAAVHLAPRERAVVALVVDGLTAIQIGNRLHLSPRTVEYYIARVRAMTGSPNRAALVAYAFKHGWVER